MSAFLPSYGATPQPLKPRQAQPQTVDSIQQQLKDPSLAPWQRTALQSRLDPNSVSDAEEQRASIERQNASWARQGELEGIKQGAAQGAAQGGQPQGGGQPQAPDYSSFMSQLYSGVGLNSGVQNRINYLKAARRNTERP